MTQAAGSVRVVFLRDHVKSTFLYKLDRESGEYERIAVSSQLHISGVGAEFNNGLWRAPKILVATLADDRSLWLRVGRDEFNLLDPAIRVAKRKPFPFVRVFEIRLGEQLLTSITFWANVGLELSDWPVTGDFVDFVRSLATSRDELLQAFLRWNATAAGKNIMDRNTQLELQADFVRLKARDAGGPENWSRVTAN